MTRVMLLAIGLAASIGWLLPASRASAQWNPFRKASSRSVQPIAPDPFEDADRAANRRQLLGGSPLVHDNHHQDDDEPGWLTRLGQGTQEFFAGARDSLRLGGRRESSEQGTLSEYSPWSQTGSGRKKPSTTKRGWFSGWFVEDEPRQAETVEDWIAQDRPK